MIRILIAAFITVLIASPVQAQVPAQLEADLAAHPDHMSARLQLAGIYIKQNEYDKVIALLNAYTDQLPADGFLALASSYSNKKDFTGEIRVLGLLVAKYEEDYRWHMLLAEAYLKAANVQPDPEKNADLTTNAIQQLRKILQNQPKYKPAFDRLLATLLTAKKHNEARELLTEGISKFGERPDLYRDLCRLNSTDGFLDEAVSACRDAIRLAPTFPDNYVYLVQSLHDQKEPMQAERTIVNAAKRFPKAEFVQWAAGTLFLRKKNFPVAARYFTAAVAADAKSNRAEFGLAQAMYESGDPLGSLNHYIKACAAGEQAVIDNFLAAGGKLKQSGNYKLGEQFVQKANTCRK